MEKKLLLISETGRCFYCSSFIEGENSPHIEDGECGDVSVVTETDNVPHKPVKACGCQRLYWFDGDYNLDSPHTIVG